MPEVRDLCRLGTYWSLLAAHRAAQQCEPEGRPLLNRPHGNIHVRQMAMPRQSSRSSTFSVWQGRWLSFQHRAALHALLSKWSCPGREPCPCCLFPSPGQLGLLQNNLKHFLKYSSWCSLVSLTGNLNNLHLLDYKQSKCRMTNIFFVLRWFQVQTMEFLCPSYVSLAN